MSNVIPLPVKEDVSEGQSVIAERFVKLHKDKFMYVAGLGFHEYDGKRWSAGTGGYTNLRAEATVIDVAREIIADRETNKTQLKAATEVLTRDATVKGVIGYLRRHPQLLVAVDQLNADPMLLNVGNGTLDLSTGKLRKHRPADRITQVAGADYYHDAQGDRWRKFLNEALDDPELITAVGQCFGGVGLPGVVRDHVLPVVYGPTGTGKGTFIEAVSKALGDYAIAAEPDIIMPSVGKHPTGLMDLFGKRLAFVSESEDGKKMATAGMKRLTGGDTIRARRMHQDFVEFTPSHLLCLITNHLPTMPAGDDPAVWRRVRVVPFNRPPANPDKRLTDQLADELPAVLSWLIDGHRSYVANGLDIAWPEQVTAATDNYRSQSDLIGQFLDDATEVASALESIPVGKLYGWWKNWISENAPDAKPGRTGDFTQRLRDKGEDVETVTGGRIRSSVRGRRERKCD